MIRLTRNICFCISQFNAQKNYYQTLNLSEAASESEIKKAFHMMAKKYHPDTHKGTEEKFKEVNEAYQVLSSKTIKE